MPFSIAFEDGPLCFPHEDPKAPAANGILVFGEESEHFQASLFQWSRGDYEQQWRHAIKVLLQGKTKAALITTYGSPQIATHLEWWPMYLVGDKVFFQDQLLFYNQLSEPFSIQNAFSFLRDRETVNDEGKAISEWSVPLSDVEDFSRTMCY